MNRKRSYSLNGHKGRHIVRARCLSLDTCRLLLGDFRCFLPLERYFFMGSGSFVLGDLIFVHLGAYLA
jgi:hypothetical protein